MVIVLVHLSACHKASMKKEYFGEFYANDCGESHGGFEWAGEYSASLIIDGNKGSLRLTFSIGLGDPLKRHEYSVSDFAEGAGGMSFKIEGKAAFLLLVEDDHIWDGKYNGYYAANWTSNPSEQIGQLPIGAFSGFRPHYYIELRLKPLEPQSSFFRVH